MRPVGRTRQRPEWSAQVLPLLLLAWLAAGCQPPPPETSAPAPPPPAVANNPAPPPTEGFAFADLASVRGAESIRRLHKHNVLKVPPDLLFHPQDSVRRDDFVAWFVQASETPTASPEAASFEDVPPDSEHYSAIEGALKEGLILAPPGGNFQPARGFSRARFCQFLLRLTGHSETALKLTDAEVEEYLHWDLESDRTDPKSAYGDAEAIVPELRPAVAEATRLGYVKAAFEVSPTRYRPSLRPLKRVTRAEAAAVIDFLFFQP